MSQRVLSLVLMFGLVAVAQSAEKAPNLKVSENHRFLVTSEGKPFFWLGDTAWELFHRTTREQAIQYLDKRQQQGFNVIQVVAIAEMDGHSVPNSYGFLPLTDLDPTKPAIKDGPENDYWDHVDFVVDAANQRGIVVGFLPTWGRFWHDKISNDKPIFDAKNAYVYGQWLGKRYKYKQLVWILGGDRKLENESQKEIIRAMAKGLREADDGTHLMTLHPSGGQGSAQDFHAEAWLDFNMRQNGHVAEFTGRYDQTKVDYDRTPIKPVLDGEPIYEDHPVSFNAKMLGHSNTPDVRRPFYWDVFTGACGHTYGHHSIWQMWEANRPPINNPLNTWQTALDQPGANQMIHGRRLIESRPFLTRIPDDSIIVTDRIPTLVPGAGRYRFVATRDQEGTYAMVYVPIGRSFSVNLNKIKGESIKAWWFNPRTGTSELIGNFANTSKAMFTPPNPGEQLDWVLVLDDATKNYSAPGSK
jgi:hypothetical protein